MEASLAGVFSFHAFPLVILSFFLFILACLILLTSKFVGVRVVGRAYRERLRGGREGEPGTSVHDNNNSSLR